MVAGPPHYALLAKDGPWQAQPGQPELVGELPLELARTVTGAISDVIRLRAMALQKGESVETISTEDIRKDLKDGQFWQQIVEAGGLLLDGLIEALKKEEQRRR
ncbi:hypothetical protein [Nonomuraea salmonea]|uniref:Uncharacterized protein n=1 Tax=Nonomuraea salmonea TaxID=46181 RepID=A0ABV5NYB3_9ACTN